MGPRRSALTRLGEIGGAVPGLLSSGLLRLWFFRVLPRGLRELLSLRCLRFMKGSSALKLSVQ